MIQFRSSNQGEVRPVGFALKGFSLIEVLVSAGLFTVMVALVMGMVVYQSRFGLSLGNYADMNTASRKVMTQFEQDMRMARVINADFSTKNVTAKVYDTASTAEDVVSGKVTTSNVEYSYDKTTGTLSRNGVPLLTELVACEFLYFDQNDGVVLPAKNPAPIKKILIAATMRKSLGGGTGGVSNSDYLVSAIVTMRCRNNK